MLRRVAVVMSGALLLAACANAEGGYTPQQQEVGEIPGARGEQTAAIGILGNGCYVLELEDGSAPWIVWPPGIDRDDEGRIELGGVAYSDGDAVVVVGARLALEELPDGGAPEGYFGMMGRYCGADERGVVVLDSIAPAAG